MTLSKKDIERVLKMITVTRDDEIDCDGFLDKMSVFAETELAGKHLSEALRAVERHLAMCPECQEEYRTLLEALRALEER